jgi:hypothetical protein
MGPYDEPCSPSCEYFPARHTHVFCPGSFQNPSFGDWPFVKGQVRRCVSSKWVERVIPGGVVVTGQTSVVEDEGVTFVPCPRCGQRMLASNWLPFTAWA